MQFGYFRLKLLINLDNSFEVCNFGWAFIIYD